MRSDPRAGTMAQEAVFRPDEALQSDFAGLTLFCKMMMLLQFDFARLQKGFSIVPFKSVLEVGKIGLESSRRRRLVAELGKFGLGRPPYEFTRHGHGLELRPSRNRDAERMFFRMECLSNKRQAADRPPLGRCREGGRLPWGKSAC